MNLDDLTAWAVSVGRISGRWGHADLKVQPFSTMRGRFSTGARLCAVASGQRQLLTVEHSRRSGHSWIIGCGLLSVEEADNLRGAELFIHESMRPPLAAGEFYLDQLIGLRVRTESGEELGEITEILETPAHLVYVTPCAMIPGHADFITQTDLVGKLLVVRDVPGLRTDGREGS